MFKVSVYKKIYTFCVRSLSSSLLWFLLHGQLLFIFFVPFLIDYLKL